MSAGRSHARAVVPPTVPRSWRAADGRWSGAGGGPPAALTICEDAWNDKQFWDERLYMRDPVEELAAAGARMILSINASPYHMGKRSLRRHIFQNIARRYKMPVV